jgi:hypothetical protein
VLLGAGGGEYKEDPRVLHRCAGCRGDDCGSHCADAAWPGYGAAGEGHVVIVVLCYCGVVTVVVVVVVVSKLFLL